MSGNESITVHTFQSPMRPRNPSCPNHLQDANRCTDKLVITVFKPLRSLNLQKLEAGPTDRTRSWLIWQRFLKGSKIVTHLHVSRDI